MKFIIFSSLTTIIFLVILLYIFLRIYKRIKPTIKGALNVVDSTATAITNCSKEFIQNINENLSTYNAKQAVENIRELYDNNIRNLHYLNSIMFTDEDKNKIKEKSRKIAAQYYFSKKKEFKEYKITAIKSRDINLISEIDKLEAQLDFCYEKITNLKDFVAIEAIEKIKT